MIPKRAWSPAAIGTIKYIPQPNIDPAAGTYSDNSQRNTVTDNKIGERVDFDNSKTGNWSFYYHFDDSTVLSALPSGGASVPGFPARTPTRAQEFVISNTKILGPTAVNEARLTFFRTSTHLDNPTGGTSFAFLSGFRDRSRYAGDYPRCLSRISGVCAPALLQQLHHRCALSDHVPAQQHLHHIGRGFQGSWAGIRLSSGENSATCR